MTPSVPWKRLLVGELSLKRLLRSLALIYVALAIAVYVMLDGLVLLPQPSTYHDGPGLVHLPMAAGGTITAAWLPNPKARYTVLYSHGNAEDLGENLDVMRQIRDLGFSVMIYDYPGYGTSPGTPSEGGCNEAIAAAYAHLTGPLHVPANRLIAYGRSVGGAPTCWLATRKPIAGMVLESTFVDPVSVKVPWRILPYQRYPSLARLRAYQGPLLVMHGEADDLIPVWNGKRLFEAARGPKQSLWVPGAGHDDFKDVAGPAFEKALRHFAASLPTGEKPLWEQTRRGT